MLERFESGDVSPDDWRAYRLVNGVYGQRQDDVYMIRCKIPQGVLTAPQLDALAARGAGFGGRVRPESAREWT